MAKKSKNEVPRTNSPKFFKIIFDPRSPRLRIPGEFMRRHGQNLCNPVSLKVPTGTQMEVELLVKGDGEEAWLQKGWPEFRERYSIGLGHLLVFECIGNAMFNVRIFDLSALEIEYHKYDERMVDTDSSDDSVVFLEEIPPCKKAKFRGEALSDAENTSDYIEISDSPHMKKRIMSAKADDCKMRSSVSGIQNLSSVSITRGGLRSKSSSHNKQAPPRRVAFDLGDQTLKPTFEKECGDGGNGRQSSSDKAQGKDVVLDKEKSVAYQNAAAFMSRNAFQKPFFIVLLQPSYVSGRYSLSVPLAFAEENLPGRRNDLTLRVLDGKTWPVRCAFTSNGKFTSGWKAFVEDNGLKLGDACIFEVVNRSKLIWNVTVFRN